MQPILSTRAEDPTTAIFGMDSDGHPYVYEISKGPHWLVAGTTGSGKSAYTMGIISSMLYHSHPEELEIMAIDPKKVEFGKLWHGLPHMRVRPVTEMQDAYGLLKYLVAVMEKRYSLLEEVGVKNIADYNKLIVENDSRVEDDHHGFMRYIVCIIDEYADLVMQEPEVEEEIVRLAQKARAAGVHLLIATQRPSADIISSTIKSNVGSRIGLRTNDSNNSSIIIDEPGLEELNGLGDSIVKDPQGEMTRVQGLFLPDPQIHALFDQIKANYGESEAFDYKQVIVDLGLVDWAEEYDEDTPPEERHVKKKRRRAGIR